MFSGILRLPLKKYGCTAQGSPLHYIPCTGECSLLVVAGIHGEEPETTFLLSRALRLCEGPMEHTAFVLCANPDGVALGTRGNANGVDLNRNFPTGNWSSEPETTFLLSRALRLCEGPMEHTAFVLCANPDGVALGTRGNANGVDLNRNFPTGNWSSEPVRVRSVLEAERDTELSPGNSAGSEPETQALVHLIEELGPRAILSMHAPIGCVDAPEKTPLVQSLSETFRLPWKPDIGYPTPGSLGTWCKEGGTGGKRPECITLELPRMSPEALYDRYGKDFARWIAGMDG